MAEVILMPRLSDTMTEGVIAAWHKKVGDPVKKGDLLAEVETDKATMELESYKDGTLLHIGSEKGGKLQVNDLLAIIGAPGEDISSMIKGNSAPAPTKEITAKEPVKETVAPAANNPQPAMDLSKMDEVVLMPRLSDTMEEGLIAAWLKNVGDPVKKGEVLAEIETDKATMELESYKNGTLLYIGAQKGEKIPVNALLCIIGEKGKVDVEAIVAVAKAQGTRDKPAPRSISEGGAQAEKAQGTSNKVQETPLVEEVTATAVKSVSQPDTDASSSNGRMKASPLAKKLAKEKGIDLKTVHGSGDGGRIIKADIDSFVPAEATADQAPAARPAVVFTPVSGEEGYTDIPNSQVRNVIAKKLAESMYSAPHFYLTMEINMDNCIAARTQMNEVSPVKISFNDLVVKAVALSLRQHPAINASWLGDKIRRHHHIHIGIAVAIEDGLIVPVIRFADQKGLPQIAAESKELSGKAKNRKLQPNEFTGNTFTISNLGMMDIDEFTAIINPPDSCILAVGRIRETVIRKGEVFAATQVMKVTLSCDHRSVDGATGAAFLQTVKKFLENPITMFF
jgi:pyruvate dehydrogenase E2 component (dihydrolipoamide acetyltransferase)